MKRIFLLFTIVTALFNACSNDNTLVSDNEVETYPISFRITTPLAIDGSTFKSTAGSEKILDIALSIYDEKGSLVTSFLYNRGESRPDVQYLEDGSTQIQVSLPKGIYHLAFYTIETASNSPIKSLSLVMPIIRSVENFSDAYPLEGTYNYYESITTTVAPTNQDIDREITLKPMWSNLNITLDDAQKFNVPEGTDAIQFIVSPLYTGFHLNTKLSTNKVSDNWVSVYSDYKTNIISLDQIRANATFTYPTYVYQTLPENGNLAIKLNYLQTKNTTDTIILKTRELQIPDITIENGYNYNIKGNLDAVNNNQSMSISLGEFNKEAVEINF